MASKRRLRRKQCNKIQHKTIRDALLHRFSLKDKGVGMRAYKCKFCSFYHIGHIPLKLRIFE